jgi:hypothetical protein
MAPFVDSERPAPRVFLVSAEANLYVQGDNSDELEYVMTVYSTGLAGAFSEYDVKAAVRKKLMKDVSELTVEFDILEINFGVLSEASREELKDAASEARPRKEIERQKK